MLTRRQLIQQAAALAAARAAVPSILSAQAHPFADTQAFLAKAEALKPILHETAQPPLSLVKPVADSSLYLRWKMEPAGSVDSLASQSFGPGQSFLLDFGGHRTGYLSFHIEGVGRNIDAPARLRLTFGEVPGDVADPLHPYKGTLSESWLPEEIITIDFLPQQVRLPRRYAFRYVKVEVLSTSSSYTARFSRFQAHAVTSATGTVAPLPASVPASLRRIDEVSLATLRDCMQTTFEDGPRRDQRLWTGDLRLQALTNYATFHNYALVRRCLYLLAAFPSKEGLLPADVFEKPEPHAAGDFCLDYSALYVAVLADYAKASGDLATVRDLWPLAQRQLELLSRNLNSDGLFVDPQNAWIFIDWQQGMDHNAPMHGVLLYSYRRGLDLAQTLGDTHTASDYTRTIARMTSAARVGFYDTSKKLFVSGAARQVSWASQAWLVLAGVVEGETAAAALANAMADPGSIRPGTPYMYHHVVSALVACGQKQKARKLIEDYWGAMVADGADTFWEVFDPAADSKWSPYGDVHINSFCHAWSCTPAYFLRTPGLLSV